MVIVANTLGVPLYRQPAAPYVSQKCAKKLDELLPYVDFFFSNLDEALAFAQMKGYQVGGFSWF